MRKLNESRISNSSSTSALSGFVTVVSSRICSCLHEIATFLLALRRKSSFRVTLPHTHRESKRVRVRAIEREQKQNVYPSCTLGNFLISVPMDTHLLCSRRLIRFIFLLLLLLLVSTQRIHCGLLEKRKNRKRKNIFHGVSVNMLMML